MAPRHHRASTFLSKGLFNGLSSFSELEGRISVLPTEQERGDALEVFAEAYLTTQKIAQAKEVWPGDSVPAQTRKQLVLPSGGIGVDGVFENYLSELIPP